MTYNYSVAFLHEEHQYVWFFNAYDEFRDAIMAQFAANSVPFGITPIMVILQSAQQLVSSK